MTTVRNDFEVIKRSEVERLALIMGGASAAARALEDADSYHGNVRFWVGRQKRQYSILVEKIPSTINS